MILVLILVVIPTIQCIYHDTSYDVIQQRSAELNGPFAKTVAANLLFDIPPATPKGILGGSACSPNVIRVTDIGSIAKDRERPQIFISGEIHGDERVGPLASLVTAELLVWASNCEVNKMENFCKKLIEINIQPNDIIWLAYLATRRDSFIVPTANCLGYTENRRDDAGIDPNRDFSYGRKDNNCMTSTTAKIIDSIMNENLIQMVITFHGGMTAISYTWGSNNHKKPNDKSPDENSNFDIANYMQQYAGKAENSLYPVGRMNSIVYPVDGGMEDWIYAAGWDKDNVAACKNMKSDKNGADNKAVVFLVETSDRKKPLDTTLGSQDDILNVTATSNGHIPRNVRLSLLAVDVLQPYNCLTSISAEQVTGGMRFNIKWTVGGGFNVDSTWVSIREAPMHYESLYNHQSEWSYILNSLNIPATDPLDTVKTTISLNGMSLKNDSIVLSANQMGKTRWNDSHASSNSNFSYSANFALYSVDSVTDNTKKSAVTVTSMKPGKYWIIVWSRIDSKWGQSNQGFPYNTAPQSYLANARTSSNNWDPTADSKSKHKNDRHIKGRKYWPSDPILVTVHHDGSFNIDSTVLNCAWWDRSNTFKVVSTTNSTNKNGNLRKSPS